MLFSRRSLATLGVVAVLAGACGSDPEPDVGATDAASTPSEPEAPSETETTESPAVAPLTGEQVDREIASRPVLAVKIENTQAARPQAGLDVADVVYEELVEGGITRFIALFQSEYPEIAGPVRSARLVDVEILPAHRAVLAYSGARDEVNAALRRANIPLITEGDPSFYREGSRRAPHNLFVRPGDALQQNAAFDSVSAAEPQWTFAAEPPAGGVSCPPDATECTTPGESIEIRLSQQSVAGWTYDAAAGVYRRSQNGAPQTVTGEGQVGAANVVALATDVGPGGCCDGAGNPFTVTRVSGDGRAVILRDGAWYEARWSKTGPNAPLQLTTADGTPFPLKPGASWIHLAPTGNLPAAP